MGSPAAMRTPSIWPTHGFLSSGFASIRIHPIYQDARPHEGIDISAEKRQPVRAIAAGKIAYSGELPNYGRMTIVDHGDHFYSLCAHLGEMYRKVGEAVASGDPIGTTDDSGTPVYFEIRSRNVAVNPQEWVAVAAGTQFH